MLDDHGYEEVMKAGEAGYRALQAGRYEESAELWGNLTQAIQTHTTDFSYYNVLVTSPLQPGTSRKGPAAVKVTSGRYGWIMSRDGISIRFNQ